MKLIVRICAVWLALGSFSLWAEPDQYRKFQNEHLQRGHALWLANCEGCHGYGIAGAPIPMKPIHWKPRLAKGKAVLYEHAINGFFGPDDSMMPERGGNPELSDDEVRTAVDYMTELATYYIENEVK